MTKWTKEERFLFKCLMAILFLVFLLAFAIHCKAQIKDTTLDLTAVQKIEYRPDLCKHVSDDKSSDTVSCKKAWITFRKGARIMSDAQATEDLAARDKAKLEPEPKKTIRFNFNPQQCSQHPDAYGRYVCRDVRWWKI